MTGRTNRRDQILDAATRLFMEHGYATTSVRQIAEEVGCTEAALYYHFKEGKRALLQAVIEANVPDIVQAVEECHNAETLHDFIVCTMRSMAHKAQSSLIAQLRWVTSEFPKLSEDERALVYEKHLKFRHVLKETIRRFVADDAEAETIVWILVFALFGYGQLMINLDMQSFVRLDLDHLIEDLAARLATGR